MLEAHQLAAINAHLAEKGLFLREGAIVDATLIAAPSSTRNREGKRDGEMRQTKKGNQWHFGMKAHIGVDAQSGLVNTVAGTSANFHDVTQAQALLHGDEPDKKPAMSPNKTRKFAPEHLAKRFVQCFLNSWKEAS